MLFDEIVDHSVDGIETMNKDEFTVSNNRGKRSRDTNKGWEIMIQWKYGSTEWEIIKDVKECYPFQISEYYHQNRIYKEPVFK